MNISEVAEAGRNGSAACWRSSGRRPKTHEFSHVRSRGCKERESLSWLQSHTDIRFLKLPFPSNLVYWLNFGYYASAMGELIIVKVNFQNNSLINPGITDIK
jgi:hypothetical protein